MENWTTLPNGEEVPSDIYDHIDFTARKQERERIIEILTAAGFETAALILQLESSVSETTKQHPKESEQST